MNNKKLISKAALGNKKSLDFICEKYKNYVYFFCTTVISDTQKAEKAFEKSFKAVFAAITKNPDIDNLDDVVTVETARACKAVSGDEKSGETSAVKSLPFAEKDKISSPSEITTEQKNLFISAFKAISLNQRIVVALNLLMDYNAKKIGEVLKLSEDKAQNTLDYGRENIKKQLRSVSGGLSKRDIIFFMTAAGNILKEAAARTDVSDSAEKAIDEIVKALEKPQKSNNRKAVVAIAVAAVLLAAVITVFVVTSNKTDNQGSTGDSPSISGTISTSQAAGKHHAEIDIKDYGVVKVELNGDAAPITVANFINLANDGFYDGLTFHRIIDGFMMQGGDPNGDGSGGSENEIKGEFSNNGVENSLSHTRGAISMARNAVSMDSASSQFFIVHEDSTFLDGDYACFGYVTDGMDIVDEICSNAVTTDSNGSVAAENQPIINSITITD